MATYAVESKRQGMRATGNVAESKEWVAGADGKRRPGEVQARDESTGLLLWDVEVLYRQTAYGRESTATGTVQVGCPHRPVLGEFAPVVFNGLVVEVRVTKAGGFIEYWRAETLDDKATGSTGTAGSGSKAAA
jgi:hypothetical protein